MSSILITGGTGVIGSWVTRQLIDKGIRVVTYNRHPDTALIRDCVDKVCIVAGDVLDMPSLIRTIKDYNVERVIHMATISIDPLEANPFISYRANVDGALNVFEACRLMGVRGLVYISSKGVYDIARGDYANPICKPINEDYHKAPHTVYGATKLFMENMGLSYHRIYGLDFIALRFATTYGPGKAARHGYTALASRIIESTMLGQPLTVSQDIDKKDDMIYAKDIANGIVLACFVENPEHHVFHLGTGKGQTIRQVIEITGRIFGEVPIQTARVPGP